MDKRPNVSVKLMLRSGNKIFMLKHRANGAYDFPGGHIEWAESPMVALLRELKEELDYKPPETPSFFGYWNYVSEDRKHHDVFLYFFLDVPERPTFEGITEDADLCWLNKKFYLELFNDDARVERMFSPRPVQ